MNHKTGDVIKLSIYEQLINKKANLALVGLGYVGMPIAVAFAKKGLNVTVLTLIKQRLIYISREKTLRLKSATRQSKFQQSGLPLMKKSLVMQSS